MESQGSRALVRPFVPAAEERKALEATPRSWRATCLTPTTNTPWTNLEQHSGLRGTESITTALCHVRPLLVYNFGSIEIVAGNYRTSAIW